MSTTETGIERIAAERKRQIEKEGWTPEHDDEHADGSLRRAAICYAKLAVPNLEYRHVKYPPEGWPISWADTWWKPGLEPGQTMEDHHAIRMLEKAGALIAAEIDRLERRPVPPWVCAKCRKPMQFKDGMCWECFGGDPGQ